MQQRLPLRTWRRCIDVLKMNVYCVSYVICCIAYLSVLKGKKMIVNVLVCIGTPCSVLSALCVCWCVRESECVWECVCVCCFHKTFYLNSWWLVFFLWWVLSNKVTAHWSWTCVPPVGRLGYCAVWRARWLIFIHMADTFFFFFST